MSTIVTRIGKGISLTWQELDDNFTNLNTDKLEVTDFHAATTKTTPVDTDEIPLIDSAATYELKKLTWSNLKTTLKTYIDTLYAKIGAITDSGLTMSTSKLLGRSTAATGAVEEIAVGSGLSFSAGSLTAPTMTASVGGIVPTPPNNTTTFLRGDGTFAAPAAGLTSGTAVASTSGTSIDFTSIPAGTKRVTFNFAALSTNGTSLIILQLGDSGGVENTGYTGTIETASSRYSFSDGFKLIGVGATTWALDGRITLELLDSATNTWTATINISGDNAAGVAYAGAGAKSLTATLDRIRLTTQGGTDTFDAGKVNILYE